MCVNLIAFATNTRPKALAKQELDTIFAYLPTDNLFQEARLLIGRTVFYHLNKDRWLNAADQVDEK